MSRQRQQTEFPLCIWIYWTDWAIAWTETISEKNILDKKSRDACRTSFLQLNVQNSAGLSNKEIRQRRVRLQSCVTCTRHGHLCQNFWSLRHLEFDKARFLDRNWIHVADKQTRFSSDTSFAFKDLMAHLDISFIPFMDGANTCDAAHLRAGYYSVQIGVLHEAMDNYSQIW